MKLPSEAASPSAASTSSEAIARAHVKLRPGVPVDEAALRQLIAAASAEMRALLGASGAG